MAKLLSHHDRYHVHAILGLSALVHFLFRFIHFFVTGRDSFSPGIISAITLGIHVMLHVTSFQFILPRNRLWTKPMIWDEFRVHNAIFAARNLCGAAIGIWAPEWWWRSPLSVSSLGAKIALVLVAAKVADVVTETLGSRDKRTTNAMPYPPETDPRVEHTAKWFYAKSQFVATGLSAFGLPFLSFGSVLAIEIASFLMTLVRKGIIEARHYHCLYGFALFIMLPAMLVALHSSDEADAMSTFRVMCITAASVRFRLKWKWNKYVAWAGALMMGTAVGEGMAYFTNFRYWIWPGVFWGIGDIFIMLFKEPDDEDSSKEALLEKPPPSPAMGGS